MMKNQSQLSRAIDSPNSCKRIVCVAHIDPLYLTQCLTLFLVFYLARVKLIVGLFSKRKAYCPTLSVVCLFSKKKYLTELNYLVFTFQIIEKIYLESL